MPNAHAVRSASSSARWINCPGSIRISDQCPEPGESEYAKEGTLAHAIGEVRIQLKRTGEGFGKLEELKASEYFDGEMDEATDFYADLVLEHLNGAGEGAELMVEQRVDFSAWVPGGFGTSDAVIVSDDTIEKVRMTIVQPRLDHVSTEELTVAELLTWGDEVARPAAEASTKPDAPTAAGDWCRWCPGKAVCRTRAEKNQELARLEFKKPDLLTDDEIGAVLRQADELAKWGADLQAYALAQALDGKAYDGWKLVEGRSIRKYKDELAVSKKLQDAGYDEAVLYERKLLGITAMEKLVGKKKLTETLGDLIEKPAGKPVLVPASDKREAINGAASAAADFKE